MTLYKRGNSDSLVTIASSVYSCPSCGHTEMVTGDKDSNKKCPKCDSIMSHISSHAEVLEDEENLEDEEEN